LIENEIAYVKNMLTEDTNNSEELSNSIKQAYEVDKILTDITGKFIDYLLGYDVPEISLDSICFPKRYFNVNSIEQLSSQQEEVIRSIISECFNLGLSTHLIFMKFPTRGREINCEALFQKFLPKSLAAYSKLRRYNKDLDNQPEAIFNYYFDNEVDHRLTQHFQFGFFKKPKVRNTIKNYYYCGILLGMMYDMETNYQ
jgi:hypothetical protein